MQSGHAPPPPPPTAFSQADAGADIVLEYPSASTSDRQQQQRPGPGATGGARGGGPSSSSGWGLVGPERLPRRGWPEPTASCWSPFSGSGRDYVRVAGPGVYVGCAYRGAKGGEDGSGGPGELREENFVYFLLVRRHKPAARGPGP